MASSSILASLDGLRALAHNSGVEIKPTLLRVLTDLYVQTPAHSADEERQYVELAARLIPEVDEATRSIVRERLSHYPRAPLALLRLLATENKSAHADPETPMASPPGPAAPPSSDPKQRQAAPYRTSPTLNPARICKLFFDAPSEERAIILANLEFASLSPALPPAAEQTAAVIVRLEHAAFGADKAAFAEELSAFLDLDRTMAARIVDDPGGEALACIARAIGMPRKTFHRILMFMDPAIGTSAQHVAMLTKLYDEMAPRAALVMLSLLRSTNEAAPASILRQTKQQHQPMLYDDETYRVRPSTPVRPAHDRARTSPTLQKKNPQS